MDEYYHLKISSDMYGEIIEMFKEKAEQSTSFLEIKQNIDRISYLKFEREQFMQKKKREDYTSEIEQSTIDGFIRYLIQVKHFDARVVVGTIRDYYNYISDINSSYFTKEKTADVMNRIEDIAFDDEVDEMPILDSKAFRIDDDEF